MDTTTTFDRITQQHRNMKALLEQTLEVLRESCECQMGQVTDLDCSTCNLADDIEDELSWIAIPARKGTP